MLDPSSSSSVASNSVPSSSPRTFSDIIEDVGDLPNPRDSEELEWAINTIIFSGEDDVQFQDAWITTRPVNDAEIEQTVVRDDQEMHRLECEITGTTFYLPVGALVPVVAFQPASDEDESDLWTRRIHPHLVAAGREAVMEALISSYLRNRLVDAAAECMWILQQLNVLREKETLEGGWPDFGSLENPKGYAVDPKGAVPSPTETPGNPEGGKARDPE